MPAKFTASHHSPLEDAPSPIMATWNLFSLSCLDAKAKPVIVADAIGNGAVGGRTPCYHAPICKSLPPAYSCPPSIGEPIFPI